MRKRLRLLLIRIAIFIVLIISAGFLIPQKMVIPVKGASVGDWHPETFWYYPWGKSVTHKGVDIFAPLNRSVISSVSGLVVYCGRIKRGGQVILILGPKWRMHYFAHLGDISVKKYEWVKGGETIGKVGCSGNAKGKAPHLHYSIVTLLPYPWRIDSDRQGWKKMFYLAPLKYFPD